MANVTKRLNKDGSQSYLIRAFIETGSGGKQIVKSMTWRPPAGMRPTAADKQAEKEAVLFEERARSGVASLDSKVKLSDYATRWMETAQIAPKTREQYDYLLKRINKALGHISLEKLRAEHLQAFYKNLREAGIKETGYAVASTLDKCRRDMKLKYTQIAVLSGLSADTVSVACHGGHVSLETARKISAALDRDISTVFNITQGTDALSDRSIWHYHKLIRAILTSAKKLRIIPHNVASEYMDAPKLPREEARYLSDEEARCFLAALQAEPDIRIKAALTLELFTGVRRGELCGLSWPDVDFGGHAIHVRRASQYITGQGVIEVPTKNKSSARVIAVPPFVTLLLSEYRRWWSEYRLAIGDLWNGEKERLFIKADGSPIFPSTINHWLRGFIARNNLPDATPHTLRHTFASLQLAAGVDVRTLQARTGHAQASTLLNVYSHALQSAQERAAQAMGDMLLPALSKNNPAR